MNSPLSRALQPLYRGYLRRLDEMAARVPEGALACEATTWDDNGRLLLGADGFPLCFDVVDRRSGETFEVRGAKADAPGAAEVQFGALNLRLLPGNWEALPLACAFDGRPVREDAEALANLVRAWALVAAHGGFASQREARGTEGADRWSGRLHSLSIELYTEPSSERESAISGRLASDELRALFDLGTCPPAALEPLFEALASFGRDRAPIARATLGGPPPGDS